MCNQNSPRMFNHLFKTVPLLKVVILCCFIALSKTSVSQSNNYIVDSNLLQQPTSFKIQSISGVAVDKDDNIYVFHRADRKWNRKYPEFKELIKEPAIVKYSKKGKLLDSFGTNTFLMPHMITVDLEGNIWAVDVWLQQVIKLDKKGTVQLRLGELFKPGTDSLHFDLPTDIAVLKDHSFYIADGYGNSRIAKFSKNGDWEFARGKKGIETGEFNLPHSIAIFKDTIFVADRENARLQLFDLKGNFISTMYGA